MKDIPDSLRAFGRLLHQDVFLNAGSTESVINGALRSLTRAQRHELKRYVADLLAVGRNNADLRRAWQKAVTDWQVPKGKGLRAFFETLRDSLDDA